MEAVKLHLGESVQEIVGGGTSLGFDPARYDDDIPLIWPKNDQSGEVFAYTYDAPQGAVLFPHARTIWAKQYGAVVTDVLVNASEKKLPLATIYEEAQAVAAQLERGGWAVKSHLPPLAALQQAMGVVRGPGAGGVVASYAQGEMTAHMSIEAFGGNAPSPGDLYVLSVQFSDEALQSAQQQKVYAEHARVKGNINAALPLSYWLKQAR